MTTTQAINHLADLINSNIKFGLTESAILSKTLEAFDLLKKLDEQTPQAETADEE